ncbi:hypothetical protein Ancab_008972 [Ancistrocladus abbreviatus]
MASPGGTSSGSSSLLQQNSSSDQEEMQLLMDERKRKRMQSNRESARRSRLRKQKHLDDLMTQVANLRKENNDLIANMNLTTQHYLKIEAENSVLRAQVAELSSRLQSLNEIVNVLNASTRSNYKNDVFGNEDCCPISELTATTAADCFMMNQWSSFYLNQPITASADMFQY